MGNAHAVGDHKIQNPGNLKAASTLTTLFSVFALVGIVAFALTYKSDPARAWASLLGGHFYFMAIAMGGLFFVAIQWITSSMWSSPVRRLAEAFTAYLPFVLISSVMVFLGAKSLYIWTHEDHVIGDVILEGKQGYLNLKFMIIRTVIAVIGWNIFARILVRGSLDVDAGVSKYKDVYIKNRAFGVGFIAFFAITFSMAAFDQLMSLDPHWFSTMFGVYVFAGAYQSFYAVLAIVVICMKRAGYLNKIINENHIHDIAKWMFAFTVFWAYTGFSQYMLIWYANMPEETGYFLLRFNPGWEKISIGLFMGKFIFPFLALLPRKNKRTESVVLMVAFWILAMQFLDLNWMIQPQFSAAGLRVGFAEIGTWLGFLGIFGLLVVGFLKKNPVVAIKDSLIEESVHHHHI
jgi:hypothetical protein